MGLKISAALGFLLLVSAVGFKLHYDKSKAEIENLRGQLKVAAANQETLESEIEQQNAQLLSQQQKASEMMAQVGELQKANKEATAEVASLRAKFAKHDLNMLSLRKPKLIEKIINKGTKEVFDELAVITTHD